jgi:hypothetical protein
MRYLQVCSTLLALSCVLSLVACGSEVTCSSGELKYVGRPPQSLFSYDTTCRADCFSQPPATCAAQCAEVSVSSPQGYLDDDRVLNLIDPTSLQVTADGSLTYGLVFSFSFVDETGGSAPAGWDFIAAGPRSYRANQLDGSARFKMEATVMQLVAGVDGVYAPTTVISGPIEVKPGRLNILEAQEGRLRGEFFIGFETASLHPQGQVHGCFDAGFGEESATTAGGFQRLLGFL